MMLRSGVLAILVDVALAVSQLPYAEQECETKPLRQTERQHGSASVMLQFTSMPTGEETLGVSSRFVQPALFEEESSEDAHGLGDSAPMNEDGYLEVASTCCILEMDRFARRVLNELGLEVCNEGGLAGTIGYHTCGASGVQSYAKLLEDIQGGATGSCAWLGTPGYCPDFDFTNCPSYPDNFHRRRICSGSGVTHYAAADQATTNAPATTTMQASTLAPAYTTVAPTTTVVPYTTAAHTTVAPTTTAASTVAATTMAAYNTAAPTTEAITTTAAPTTAASTVSATTTAAPTTAATTVAATSPTIATSTGACVAMPPGQNTCTPPNLPVSTALECEVCENTDQQVVPINEAKDPKGCFQFLGTVQVDGGSITNPFIFNSHPTGGSQPFLTLYCHAP